jgi:tetratricopeptide (TPR) repeat protein
VAWHRCLQECYPSAADKRELAKRYDTLLSTSPNDAAALYLRGRLCSTSAETVTWSDRAIAADPQLPWPWMAKAWHAGCRGDWEESRELAAKAVEFGAKDDAEPLLFTALIATKNFTEAEGLFRERLSSASINESHRALLMLMMTLCAQGKSSQAISAADDWIGQLSAHLPANEVERFRGEMLGLSEYMSRDLPALGERVSAGAVSPQLRLQYWLASKQPEKVLKDAEVEPLAEEGWGAVAMSLSFELAVQPDLASEWRQKAAARLAQGDFEEVTAGAILMADKPPRTKPFMELGLDPAQKALLAALVAVRFPDQKAEFVEIARKLNVLPEGYSALIEQVFGL